MAAYRDLMKKAHQIAKQIRRAGERYAEAFSVALRAAWAELKETTVAAKKTSRKSARKPARPENLQGSHYWAIKCAVKLGYYSQPENCPLPADTDEATKRDLAEWGYATPAGRLTERGFDLGCRLNS